MAHSIIHTEIYASNHEQLGAWYAKVFGWKVESYPDMNYTTTTMSDEPGGGVGFNDAKNGMPPGQVIPYIYSSAIEADAAMLAENGAEVNEVMQVPGVGKMCHFKDPDGNLLALMQPEMPANGAAQG
jgi:predicted enzyme related to lactoylglutathione lyase